MKKFGNAVAFLFIALITVSCEVDEPSCPDSEQLVAGFELLPEKRVANDQGAGLTARYIYPVDRYTHGILGDAIEAGALLVTQCDQMMIYKLDTLHVFEDLQPRLVDVTNDGTPEIITILTSVTEGASVAVFQIDSDSLMLKAQSDYIGRRNRWLNIAAVNDLDVDGVVEIAWVSTPHIGGLLKVSQIEGDQLVVKDTISGVSNHRIHTRNLCLSVISIANNQKVLYVPNDAFDALIGLQWKNDQILPVDTIFLEVDPNLPLPDQYNFGTIAVEYDCD